MKPTRLTLILAISTALFLIYSNKRSTFRPKKISPMIKEHLSQMKTIQSKNNFALTRAFVIGDKRSLKKDQKKEFSKLKINHLFTPSGIHFSSFFIIFIPLIRFLKKKKYIFASYALEFLLCLIPFGLNQLYSLKRISLLRISNLSLRPFKVKIDFFYLFIATFIFDFFFGTFNASPLSFTFSFLFIGVLLSTEKSSFILISFFVANLLISFFFHQNINILGFFLGFFITMIFSFLFPMIFLSYWPSSFVGIDLTSPFLFIIKSLVSISAKLANYSPDIEIDLIGLILIFLFSLKRKTLLLALAITLSSCRIYNIPQSRIRPIPKESSMVIKSWKIKNLKQVYKDKKLSCSRRIILSGHQVRCRDIKKGR